MPKVVSEHFSFFHVSEAPATEGIFIADLEGAEGSFETFRYPPQWVI